MSVPMVLAALLTANMPVARDVTSVPLRRPAVEASELVPTPPVAAVPLEADQPEAEPLAQDAAPILAEPVLTVAEQEQEPEPEPETTDDTPAIIVTGRPPSADDPLEKVNAQSFEATQDVDQAVVRPAAMAYKNGLPEPVRDGLNNFFLNLHEPVVALNYLLQLKPGKALETAGRFLVNSTLGAAGLFDVAKSKPFRLPRRPNGLANTLGFYGVKPGPFFFLPLIGPTTLRDSFGNLLDGLLLPTVVGKPFTSLTYTVPSTIIRSLSSRIANDERLIRLNATADPYRATRDRYLQERREEIDRLHTPRRTGETGPFTPGMRFGPAPVPGGARVADQ